MGFVLVMTAVALAAAFAIGLSDSGSSERAKSLLPHAVIRVVSGWCKQNRDAGYVDTWVLVRNVGQRPYPETRSSTRSPTARPRYGGEGYPSPAASRALRLVPVGWEPVVWGLVRERALDEGWAGTFRNAP